MKAFTFVRPTTIEEASKEASAPNSVIKAGGIDLLDRMKERVDEPERVVSLGDLTSAYPPGMVSPVEMDGKLALVSIAAAATLQQIAASEIVATHIPALAEAASLAASPQIRQRATLGGNLLQHTRCGYYRHKSFPCFKRGDEKCPVLDDGAVQDTAGIFGNRPCASAHPSSLAPVLAAHEARCMLGANVEKRRFPCSIDSKLYAPPERGRASDTAISPGYVIDCVDVPVVSGRRAVYEEVRQKAAFDWALVSCCVRIDMDGDKIKAAGVWLGSVAPTPWHAEAAEKALIGKPLTDATIAAAADAAVVGATPLPGNAYKVDLVKVVVRRALTRLRDMK